MVLGIDNECEGMYVELEAGVVNTTEIASTAGLMFLRAESK